MQRGSSNLGKKFKDFYDVSTAQLIADKITDQRKTFNTYQFVSYVKKGIFGKELFERLDVFVDAFEQTLGNNYIKNMHLFEKILGPENEVETGMYKQGYWLWPVGRYVERHGTEDFSTSINFIHELTKRFTGEFAVRPILERYPRRTMIVMKKWSKDKNVHVRRLSSEGIRIKLPWAKKSLVCVDHFSIYKEILTNLNSDPSRYVQKSVGNNLNDLYKHSPDLALEIINEWKIENPSRETRWVINHGLRSTRK